MGNHRVTLAKQSFENPMLQADSDEEDEDGSRKLANPMLADGAGDDGDDISTAQMIAANESEMGETELEDLTYAFEAADLGGEGVITDVEFGLMVRVMGCEMTEEDVKKVIAEAVDGFSSACHLPCLHREQSFCADRPGDTVMRVRVCVRADSLEEDGR